MLLRTLIAFSLLMLGCRHTGHQHDQFLHNSDALKNEMADSVEAYYVTSGYDGAAQYLERITAKVESSKDVGLISSWWRLRSKVASERDQHDSAFTYIQKAHDLTAGVDSLLRDYIFVIIQQGYQAAIAGQEEKAIGFGQKAYHLAKEKSPKDVPQALSLLTRIFSENGDWNKALLYARESLAYVQGDVDRFMTLEIMGFLYMNLQRRDSGLHYYRLAVADTARLTVEARLVRLHQVAWLLLDEGMTGEAVALSKQALETARANGVVTADLYGDLAELFRHSGQYDQAITYADSAIQHGKDAGQWDVVEGAYSIMAFCRQQAGHLAAALSAKDSARIYHIRADSATVAKQLRELDTRYQVKAKDDHIATLAAAAAAEKEVSRQRAWTIMVLIVAGLLAAGLVWVLYRRGRMRLQLREYELHQQLLRSQMEDHFIYNALSNLQYLIRSKDHDNALGYLGKFSKLMHLNQFNSKDNYVKLNKEIEALEAYLTLERIHSNAKFSFQINSYPGMEHDLVLIPPMLLQPFVENAVVHGVKRMTAPGQILIDVEKRDSVIRCRIEDNGVGYSNVTRAGARPSQSMVITRQRLAVLGKRTGKRGGLVVEQGPQGRGTVVVLDIPYYQHRPRSAGD